MSTPREVKITVSVAAGRLKKLERELRLALEKYGDEYDTAERARVVTILSSVADAKLEANKLVDIWLKQR
jgi:hypothetical protein